MINVWGVWGMREVYIGLSVGECKQNKDIVCGKLIYTIYFLKLEIVDSFLHQLHKSL